METNEKILFRDVLMWLFRQHRQVEKDAFGVITQKQREIYERIAVTWKRVENDSVLGTVLNSDSGQLLGEDRTARYVYLEPIQKENAIPIVWLEYDWTRSIPKVSFRLGIFVFDRDKELRAMGYRFETPHGEGAHHFYHAQPIQELVTDKLPCPEWIPVHQPSFVLDAVDPVTLLFSLVISLYGFEYLEKLTRTDFGSNLRKHVAERMLLLKSDYQPKYWRFIREHEVWVCITRYEDRKAKQILQTQYGYRELRTITQAEWSTHDESKRMIL